MFVWFLIGVPAVVVVLIAGAFVLSFLGERYGYVALVQMADFEYIAFNGFDMGTDLVAVPGFDFSVKAHNGNDENANLTKREQRNFDRFMLLRDFVVDLMIADDSKVFVEKSADKVQIVLPTRDLTRGDYKQLRRLFGLARKASLPLLLTLWEQGSVSRHVPSSTELDSYLFAESAGN